MKKISLFVLAAILAWVVPFGFTAQATEGDTNTINEPVQTTDASPVEDTSQASDQTVNSTEESTQTSDTTVNATEDSTQPTEKTTELTEEPDQSSTQEVTKSTEKNIQLTKAVDTVQFNDQNLAQAIRGQLGLEKGDDITQSDLMKLNFLFTGGISDLSGLEYAGNLSFLEIPGGKISDLSPLKNLTNLQTLNLSGNKITDISVLTQIPNLKVVNLADNPLNLNPGSAAFKDLQTLVGNDVRIYHDGMVQFTTKKVTKNAITVGWTIDPSDGMPHRGTLSLNGKPVKTIDIFKTAKSQYTFTGLKKGQTYDIELSMYFNVTQGDTKVTKTLHVKAEDLQPQLQVTVTPAIGGNTATIGNLNGNAIKENGTLAIDLKNYKEDQVNVQLTSEQIQMLQDKNVAVKINRGDASASIPASLLGKGKNVSIVVEKLKPVKDALSSTYDFTIKTDDGTISKFSEPVTLTFRVNPDDITNPDNVKVWYFNPSTQEWEKIGGTYSNGVVTAKTSHFSTYTVFERETTSGGSETGSGNELPETATNTMNFLLLGTLLIVLAIALLWFQKRKERS